VLADVAFPPTSEMQRAVAAGIESGAVITRVGSVADASFCSSLFGDDVVGVGVGDGDGGSAAVPVSVAVSVFHLGAVMSGTGEADFDLCLDVNMRGTMHMLEAARAHTDRLKAAAAAAAAAGGGGGPGVVKFVYASAGATIGSGDPTDHISKDDVITDASRASPHTTYGTTKAIGELLLSDYGRRGFVDGRGVRLPTVAVRAGRPNAATTGCFSSVVREPLGGTDASMPIGRDVKHAITGVRNAVEGLRTMHDASPETVRRVLGYDRTAFLPSAAMSLGELEAAVLAEVEPDCVEALGRVTYDEVDPFLSDVVGSFPTKIDASRAARMGIGPAPTASELVMDYAASFPEALAGGVRLKRRPEEEDEKEVVTIAATEGDRSHNIVAVITGGGSGIGRAVALRLAKGGWGPHGTRSSGRVCLVLAGRRVETLKETADLIASQSTGVRTSCVPTDVTDESAVSNLFSEALLDFGRVDLVFNNAGTNRGRCDAADFPLEDFERIVGANLTGSFLVAREAMRVMTAQTPRGGRIVNNGSISGDRPRPGGVAYTCSKHAINGLTKTLALEGRDLDVAVGQIDFGNVTTAISDITQKTGGGALQADGTLMVEVQMSDADAANAVHCMAALPLTANVLQMTVMPTKMPFVGRG